MKAIEINNMLYANQLDPVFVLYLSWVEDYLNEVDKHQLSDLSMEKEVRTQLSEIKKKSVLNGDQDTAKLIWCYEGILSIHKRFIECRVASLENLTIG